jgi:hypothetical protein
MKFCCPSWLTRRSSHAFLVAILVSGLSAQVSDLRPQVGVPEDWSHHRIKLNPALLRQHPELAAREPRAAAQLYREAFARARAQMGTPFAAPSPATSVTAPHRDLSSVLGSGTVQFGQFPAKWQSDPTLPPSCTADYVIYALNVSGVTGGQPSIVAINNLYAGGTNPLCTGGQFHFLFSYNTNTVTNGRILTSPVLSLDGKKVAFIETTTTGTRTSVLHILKIPANPAQPVFTAVPSTAVPVGAMSSTTIGAASNLLSSPWVDYPSDTAYVALDNGFLYKITGVFNGTPNVVNVAPWPKRISGGAVLTSPVLDASTGNVFLGSGGGQLFSVNVNNPATVTTIQIGRNAATNPNIRDSVIFDPSGATLYAVTSNDAVLTGAAVVQVNATSLAVVSRVLLGQGSTTGSFVNLYDGDFDNNHVNNPATGHMLICGTGTADTTPYRYLLNFNASGILQPGSSTQISTNGAARCSPVTEFFNDNIAGGTDFFFWGVTRNCPASAGIQGCVMALTNETTLTSLQLSGGTSGILIDNNYVAKPGGSGIHFATEASPFTAMSATQQGLQ